MRLLLLIGVSALAAGALAQTTETRCERVGDQTICRTEQPRQQPRAYDFGSSDTWERVQRSYEQGQRMRADAERQQQARAAAAAQQQADVDRQNARYELRLSILRLIERGLCADAREMAYRTEQYDLVENVALNCVAPKP